MMNNNNMEIFDAVRAVPDWAKKTINGGRMNGKTDISPMWRIQALTEIFGPCGYGWKYEITDQRLEKGEGKEVKAFVDIKLYVKWGESWSEAIPGIGGNSYIDAKGYVSDECFKMALTDAISVAAKALGVGADVYMGTERTKYSAREETPAEPQQTRQAPPPPRREERGPSRPPAPAEEKGEQLQLPETAPDGYWYCDDCKDVITRVQKNDGGYLSPREVVVMGLKRYRAKLCPSCMKKREAMAR